MNRWVPGLLLTAILAQSHAVQAHTPSESFSSWRFDDNVLSMRFTVSAREASRLPNDFESAQGPGLPGYLLSHVRIGDEAAACRSRGAPRNLATRPGFLQLEMSWTCSAQPRELLIMAFLDLAAEHSHFATFETEDGLHQNLFTAQDFTWELPAGDSGHPEAAQRATTFLDYVILGFGHILSGLDHVIFLLGLLLLCRNFKDLVWAITGFTLGHSISLGLVSAGLIQAKPVAIEAAIGLTIFLVAAERTSDRLDSAWPMAIGASALILMLALLTGGSPDNIGVLGLLGLSLFSFCFLLGSHEMTNSGLFRLLITALFGVFHGFGFAGAFQAASLGAASIWLPLAGFNMGVELGQLLLVSLLFVGGRWLWTKSPGFSDLAADALAGVVCAFGVFWFVQRSLF